MKRQFGRTSSTVDNDREETPLMNMAPEAVSSGPSLYTTKRRSCVVSCFEVTFLVPRNPGKMCSGDKNLSLEHVYLYNEVLY